MLWWSISCVEYQLVHVRQLSSDQEVISLVQPRVWCFHILSKSGWKYPASMGDLSCCHRALQFPWMQFQVCRMIHKSSPNNAALYSSHVLFHLARSGSIKPLWLISCFLKKLPVFQDNSSYHGKYLCTTVSDVIIPNAIATRVVWW